MGSALVNRVGYLRRKFGRFHHSDYETISYEDSYPQLSSDGQEGSFTSLRQGANGPNSIVVRSAVNPSLAPELVFLCRRCNERLGSDVLARRHQIAVEASGYDGIDGDISRNCSDGC